MFASEHAHLRVHTCVCAPARLGFAHLGMPPGGQGASLQCELFSQAAVGDRAGSVQGALEWPG